MKRPKLVAVTEEMRRICASLGDEMLRWPGVRMHPMFGMRAFYRGKVVFALLPEKRAMENADAIAYKIAGGAKTREGKKWKLFEIATADELGAALEVLQAAYKKAGRRS
jgi:hypothetical protein